MTNQLFNRAIAAKTCEFLQVSGQGAMAYAAWSLLTPGPFDDFALLAYGGVAQFAYAAGCEWDPNQPPPTDGNTFGCVKKEPGTSNALVRDKCGYSPGDPDYLVYCAVRMDQITEITGVREFKNANGPTVSRYEIDVIKSNGTYEAITTNQNGGEILLDAGTKFSVYGDGVCVKESDEMPPEFNEPYVDPETGCTINVEMLGYVVDGANRVSPAWQLTAGGSSLRSSGGVISGNCNFAPTVVVPPFGGPPGGGGGGDGGEPPIYLPVPPPEMPGPPEEPWWVDAVREIAAGVIGELVADQIKEIFEAPYAGAIYRMVSVCEKDASGEPISEAVEVPIPELKAPDAQLARLDAIVELLQASKNFKQPVCNDRPKLEGNWRTISFRSTESSPYGKSCIRKRFRYRSLSGIGLGELVDHWKDFTWTTGPVCVTHKGYSWGTPQVWAATADEGKRVIQHAAGEAGFDANKVGEWGISNSSSSRYGVSLPVKVDTTGGYYWITDRDGSDGRPIVATSSSPYG